MARRKAMSARLRFEVFKRDGFRCAYCGAHPPDVLLEVDHIIPVAKGGENDADNLVTACQRCNRGKGAEPLSSAPESLEARAARTEEMEAQIAGYAEVMERARQRLEADAWRVAEILQPGASEGYSRTRFQSVRMFVERLGVHETMAAAEIAVTRARGREREFRYFCGVCWNKIRDMESS